MNQQIIVIENGVIVSPDMMHLGDVVVQNGKIIAVLPARTGMLIAANQAGVSCECMDATGLYVMPGMIEMHSDAIEREVQPRPGSIFPLEMAMYELEKKMAAVGITTMYHSVSSSDGTPVRNDEIVAQMIEYAARKRSEPSMIRHRIHLRYEVTNIKGLDMVQDMLDKDQIDLLSFMDHTPGQGQYASRETYKDYLMGSEHMTGEKADETLDVLSSFQDQIDWERVRDVIQYAQNKGVITASHDDDTEEKVDFVQSLGVGISEFPVSLEAACYAKAQGMFVSIGAPNIVRGGSHNKNMRAMDAVKAGAADIICSDYHLPALLPALFQISEEADIGIPAAIAMATLNPAKALGISDQYGSVEVGKIADLLLVELPNGYPLVRATLVGGTVVFQSRFFAEERVAAL
ncbi:alpha-D-ribose 1-methylphosphonate 5-triphosphate diphosphatase [Paenibacillus pini]|uniref:Metal-dependent hydrolase n=1 Tax=Paenibacillus pini JCM 16418 TaxID=1236976 RepID=W7YA98_9BACL|nr:alpha-D-ribose 1-methylphosphonate 5-triphosphate diphosphatase [Paenibacillus pini]GAF07965.1 metal-dependent hydrolase [Paenibacillus pini JCM 16418]